MGSSMGSGLDIRHPLFPLSQSSIQGRKLRKEPAGLPMNRLQGEGFFLDQQGLVPALKEGSNAPVPPVEVLGIETVDVPQGQGKVSLYDRMT